MLIGSGNLAGYDVAGRSTDPYDLVFVSMDSSIVKFSLLLFLEN